MRCTLGIDFGTESVRLLLVDVTNGRLIDGESLAYLHGVMDRELPGGIRIPTDYVFQHPQDWTDDSFAACRRLMKRNKRATIVGIGVDFTSCTMMPCRGDGTPLCLVTPFARRPMAWPKLWKHHGAKAAADRINEVAQHRNEKWLDLYGGWVSLEWFLPKVLETLQCDQDVYDAADLFIEAGDWYVWQLTRRSGDVREIVRSTCQAGYKACWNPNDRYPPDTFLAAVDRRLRGFAAKKMPGVHRAPGQRAGLLAERAARAMGLTPGIPVATAIIDAHAGVPGAGVSGAGEMVMVIGTSTGHMMNHRRMTLVPGISGIVKDGILPGFYGYEGGQASVGDAFAWVSRISGIDHVELNRQAALLPPGSGGVIATDFFNGCRSPMMDGKLSGALIGLTLTTTPAQIYRAVIEATAFGARWIFDTMRDSGVPIRTFTASGGLPPKSHLLMQIYADVLGRPVRLAKSEHAVAIGSAILGAIAAGPAASGHTTIAAAIHAMADQTGARLFLPIASNIRPYRKLYAMYRQMLAGPVSIRGLMHDLRDQAI